MTYHWQYGKRAASGLRNVTGIVTTEQEPSVPAFVVVREIQFIQWSEAPNHGNYKLQMGAPTPATIIPYPGDTYGSYVRGPFSGGVTNDIAWNASSATIKAELDAIFGPTVLGPDYFDQYNTQVGKTNSSLRIYFPFAIGIHPYQLDYPLTQIVDNTLTAGQAGNTDPHYTDTTANKTAPDDAIDLSEETQITGLEADTEYDVRLVATNANGTRYGVNQVVRTTATGTVTLYPPVISDETFVSAEFSSASITAKVEPNGADTIFSAQVRAALDGDEFNQLSHIGFRCGIHTTDPTSFIFDGYFAGVLDLNTFFIPTGWKVRFINRIGGQANGLLGNTYTMDSRGPNNFYLRTSAGVRVVVGNAGAYECAVAMMVKDSDRVRVNTPVTIGQPLRFEFTNGQAMPTFLQGQFYVKEIVASHPSVNLIKVSRTLGGAALVATSDVFCNSLSITTPYVTDRDGNTSSSGYINFVEKIRAFNAPEPGIFTGDFGFAAADGQRLVHTDLNNLSPATDYEFAFNASNSVGAMVGPWMPFTTAAMSDNLADARRLPIEFQVEESDGIRRYRENGTANGKPKYSPIMPSTPVGVHDSDIMWDGAGNWVDADGGYSSDDTPTFLTATDSHFAHDGYTIPAINAFYYASNIGATRETDEPDHAGDDTGAHSVWFKYTAPKNGTLTVATVGGFTRLLAAYTQGGVGMLGLVGVDSSDNNTDISFSVVAGTDYFIAVDGKAGGSGFFDLNWGLA